MTHSFLGAEPAKRLPDAFHHDANHSPVMGYSQDGMPYHHERTINDDVLTMLGYIGQLPYGSIEFERAKGAIARLYSHDLNTMDGQAADDFECKIEQVRMISGTVPDTDRSTPVGQAWMLGREIIRLMHANAQDIERARVEAQVDELTGALNRRGWMRALESRLGIHEPSVDEVIETDQKTINEKATEVALFFLDGMNFKRLNSLGQHIGDAGLRHMYQEVKSELREQDVPTVARLGGDEFVILIGEPSPGSQNANQAPQEDFVSRMGTLRSRLNAMQQEKIRPDANRYVQGWRKIFEKQESAVVEGRSLRSAVRAYEGDDNTQWLFIDNQPIVPFRDIVVQAVGMEIGRIESWADYQRQIERTEARMSGAKDSLHDAVGGADRPKEKGVGPENPQ